MKKMLGTLLETLNEAEKLDTTEYEGFEDFFKDFLPLLNKYVQEAFDTPKENREQENAFLRAGIILNVGAKKKNELVDRRHKELFS